MNTSFKINALIICGIFLFGFGLTTALAVAVNDNFADAVTISGSTNTTSGNNIDASAETGELSYTSSSPCQSIWYEWTAPTSPTPVTYYFNTFGSNFDTVLAVRTGTAVDSLTGIIDNDDFPFPSSFLQSRLSFSATSGTTYHIAVDGWGLSHPCNEGYVALNWGPASLIPSNDNFVLPLPIAAQLSGETGTTNATNINATPEVNEPNHISVPPTIAYSSIWFEWASSASGGEFIFDTFGSDYDTTMAVYTGIGGGTALTDLSKVAENDDSGAGDQSRVSFTTTPTTTYYIVVDGYEGLQGNVVLNWNLLPEPTVNDNFADATSISGKYGTANAFNFFATKETDEPYHADNTGPYASIWFKWTAPFTRNVIIDTFGSDYDTTLAAYTGTAVNSLTKLAENDDGGADVQSSITFPVVYGTTYYIAVDGYEGAEGNVTLNWQMKSPWILFTPPTTMGGARP